MSKRPRAPAPTSNLVLPAVEWVPGAIAVEFVQHRLPGDYTREAVSELLSAAMNEGKFLLDHKYGEIEDYMLADSMGLPQWHKVEDWLFGRQSLIDWLEGQVSDCDALHGENSKRIDEAGLKTRERDTLLKLIIGMAVKRYKYDPQATRNEATRAISDDLAELGIPLDPDTVLKWLRQAAEVLPQNYTGDE